MLEGKRKSIEPMAMRLAENPRDVQAVRQRLQRAISVARWDENEVFRRLANRLDQGMPGLEAWVVDDTGFEKWGDHSVGVKRQYSGTLGRVGNCQVVTSLHLCSEASSACIGGRLYLPQEWTDDAHRRLKAKIPDEIVSKTKPQLSLELIDRALSWGLQKRVVLADAGYGKSRDFRQGLIGLGLRYVVGIEPAQRVWPPGSRPERPSRNIGGGRPPSRYIDKGGQKPVQVRALAQEIEARNGFRRVTFRKGSKKALAGRFWAGRIHCAAGNEKGKKPGATEWLLIERRRGGELKYYFSNLPARTSLKALVRMAKLRWRVEQDYREMKDELGLDHFEGRTWQGVHHHIAMCAVAFGFLALKRALFFSGPHAANGVDSAEAEECVSSHIDCVDGAVPMLPSNGG